jgi:E3 ubiquitin-protein ligase MGRN1
MPQMQQFYLEGMRPEMGGGGGMGNLPRGPVVPQIQKTYTIRNDVNLKKGSLRLVRDGASQRYAVEFMFDASVDCSVRVYFAATEETGADGSISYSPLKPDGALPVQHRQEGLGQTFRTDASLDLEAYERPELTYTPGEGRYPLVVCLAASGAKSAVSSQTTFATFRFDAAAGDVPIIQPLKQKIMVDNT